MSGKVQSWKWAPATLAIHGRQRRAKAYHAVSTPIIQTSNYAFESTTEVVEFMRAKGQGQLTREHEYGRYGNPTQEETERKLAALEGADRAILFSPGMSAVILALFLACLLGGGPWARGDWPMYRHDRARSGYTTEPLAPPLSLRWSYRALQPPEPAWPRSARLAFDRAFQPVVAGGMVCFGSSVDGRIYALDAVSGEPRWDFPTESPVRFAPAYAHERFYAVSDDGHLYCLEARSGALLWKVRGGPNHELVLGNNRMISRWPARGGPVVVDQTVYFAAGIWPSDGIQLYAVDAVAGGVRWVNDTANSAYMGQPHGGAYAHSGVSAQGSLAATEDRLFVPTGRAVPAAFARSDGALQYFHLQRYGQLGGSQVLLSDQAFINGGAVFDQTTGLATGLRLPGLTVALPGGLASITSTQMVRYRWIDKERTDRKGAQQTVRALEKVGQVDWSKGEPPTEAIATPHHLVLGQGGSVSLLDWEQGRELWRAAVEGQAFGLAVAAGRLYVGTDRGILYCFDTFAGPSREVRPARLAEAPAGSGLFENAAARILEQSGLYEGYCLDLGCADGSLSLALARRSRLQVVAVDSDPALVAVARARLSAAGLYGSRVSVFQRDPGQTGLPLYFANLIVSGRSVQDGPQVVAEGEAARLQRPEGGLICLGRPESLQWQRRGPLPGAGAWTHQYADPANTLCSDDTRVRGPLGMLWFTDIDQRLVQRHGRPPAPLYYGGLLFSEGIDSLVAVDAYNGHLLWECALPGVLQAYDGDHLMGTSGTGSNYCISEDGLYVRQGDHCLRLEARTGQILGRFVCPTNLDARPAHWGFIAAENGLLFGSLANPDHVVTYRYLEGGDLTRQLTESKTLFALDAETGEFRWRYDARYSVRHNAIAIGAGCLILIDRPLDLFDRRRGAGPTNRLTGELVALEAATGRELWRNSDNIWGTVLALSAAQGRVLMSYQPTRFSLASETGGELACFNLSDGRRVWERAARYSSRPMINGDTVYAEGGAWDLRTGAVRPFSMERSYGCGILTGAKDLLLFRSATLGYLDLERGRETEEFGGMRPGCWVNAIPAGGLVLVPDATAGCVCSYQNQAWLALHPDGVRPPAVEPSGAFSCVPISLRLRADRPDVERVHYTLDGTTPTLDSPRYAGPFTIPQSALLRARAFGPDNRSSRVQSARFVIDSALLSAEARDWRGWDAPGAAPASEWGVAHGEIVQKANTLLNAGQAMGKDPAAERPGTLFIYLPELDLGKGEFSFEIQSSDNDTVGVAFRLQDPEHYYLWCMDSERAFRGLALKDGSDFRVLAANAGGFQAGQNYQVRVLMDGPRLAVYVDGAKDLAVEDSRFTRGTVALYCWGNAGVSFRNLTFKR